MNSTLGFETIIVTPRIVWKFWPETSGSRVRRSPGIRGKDP